MRERYLDKHKSKLNFAKHKIFFDEAVTAFFDPLAKVAADPDHSLDEDRFILIGHSRDRKLLFVVHVYIEDSETIRLISARKASSKETKDFQDL